MSNIYIQEPATSGKVILKTTLGDIEIELWSKEAPKACRNFIQLCLEGYYKGTIFHRVVKGFIAQGGDPTGSGFGGESIYGEPFKDEFHSRLRFIRRGLVAMASNEKDSNGSQFFFTLGSTPELQNKNTIFGKVVGKTLYNMIKFDDLEVDKNEKPCSPPKVLSCEVIINPFDDIVPRKGPVIIEEAKKGKEPKPKGKKDLKLLSFGDEAEEEEEELALVAREFREKSKSLHDVVKDDPKISSMPAIDPASLGPTRKRNRDESDDETRSKTRGFNNRKGRTKTEATVEIDKKNVKIEDNPPEEEDNSKEKKLLEIRKEFEALKKELSKKKVKNMILKREDATVSANSVVEEFKADSLKHKEFKSSLPKSREERAAQTLALLEKFKSKISISKETTDSTDKSPKLAVKSSFDVSALATHKFTCTKDDENVLAKDANLRNEEDWYDIYDPRNPINKRRREAGETVETKKTRGNK